MSKYIVQSFRKAKNTKITRVKCRSQLFKLVSLDPGEVHGQGKL